VAIDGGVRREAIATIHMWNEDPDIQMAVCTALATTGEH
jgi:hypothetical protein